MGIDTTITFKTADECDLHLPNNLPDGCEIRRRSGPHDDGVMYEVDQDYRYYGPGYERGPWPEIASVLMILLASEDVVSVWYHGDIQEEPGSPLTIDEVLEYSAHYMHNAHRPYYKQSEKTEMSRIECKTCDESGAIRDMDGELIDCPECNGLGWTEQEGEAESPATQWLDIKTTQPPMLESVLIATTSKRYPVRIAWLGKRFEEDTVGVWHAGPVGEASVAILEHQITHWMPLPAPPVLTDAPMMFDIWIEGYSAQGGRAGAKKIASDVVAGTFRDACIAFSKTKEAEGYGEFDREELAFFGCALHDNEDDARKNFG